MADVKVKTNLTATTAPTVNDDASAGYSVFSPWVDLAAGQVYFAARVTAGAAVWRQAIAGVSAGGADNQVVTDDGSGGLVSESGLIFDGTKLGIGIIPTNALHIQTAGGVQGKIRLVGQGNNNEIQIFGYNNAATNGTDLELFKARGTLASPLASIDDDNLSVWKSLGHDGAAFREAGEILINVDGPVSAGVIPGRIAFRTTDASGTRTERMRIDSSGNVRFGAGAAANKVDIVDGSLQTLRLRLFNDFTDGFLGVILENDVQNWELQLRGDNDTFQIRNNTLAVQPLIIAKGSKNSQFVLSASENVINDGGFDVNFRVESDGSIHALFLDASNGNFGIGGTDAFPTRRFNVEEDSAATATVTQVARLTSTSSGTPANGIGVGQEFEVETAAGNNEVGATIETVCTDVTATSEDFAMSFLQMVAGSTTLVESLRLEGNKLGFYGATTVVQPTALTSQDTSITHTTPGTPDFAIQDLVDSGVGSAFGFATKDEGNTVLQVILNLQTRVAELETKLQALGLLA